MVADTGIDLRELKVDGGASANNFSCSSRRTSWPLHPPTDDRETTALGAAYLAGLAVGFWKDLGDIKNQWTLDKIYSPDGGTQREKLLKGWKKPYLGLKIGRNNGLSRLKTDSKRGILNLNFICALAMRETKQLPAVFQLWLCFAFLCALGM